LKWVGVRWTPNSQVVGKKEVRGMRGRWPRYCGGAKPRVGSFLLVLRESLTQKVVAGVKTKGGTPVTSLQSCDTKGGFPSQGGGGECSGRVRRSLKTLEERPSWPGSVRPLRKGQSKNSLRSEKKGSVPNDVIFSRGKDVKGTRWPVFDDRAGGY